MVFLSNFQLHYRAVTFTACTVNLKLKLCKWGMWDRCIKTSHSSPVQSHTVPRGPEHSRQLIIKRGSIQGRRWRQMKWKNNEWAWRTTMDTVMESRSAADGSATQWVITETLLFITRIMLLENRITYSSTCLNAQHTVNRTSKCHLKAKGQVLFCFKARNMWTLLSIRWCCFTWFGQMAVGFGLTEMLMIQPSGEGYLRQ